METRTMITILGTAFICLGIGVTTHLDTGGKLVLAGACLLVASFTTEKNP